MGKEVLLSSAKDHYLQIRSRVYASTWRRVLFPDVCNFCGSILLPDTDSSANYFSSTLHICRRCLSTLPVFLPEERKRRCLSNPYEGDPIENFEVLVCFRYEEPITSALRSMKFRDADYYGRVFPYFMAEAISREEGEFDCVVPIPLSDKRLRKRGYNQAYLLAKPLAESLGIPCICDFLRRIRNTKQQSRSADPYERIQNISGAFEVPEEYDVTGLSVLLVDDVHTTGNTLHEAAMSLFSRGARHVAAIAVSSRRDVNCHGSMK